MNAGQSMVEIDQMDIFFYYDMLIYSNGKEEDGARAHYDNIGL